MENQTHDPADGDDLEYDHLPELLLNAILQGLAFDLNHWLETNTEK